jgi:hypothetical protein
MKEYFTIWVIKNCKLTIQIFNYFSKSLDQEKSEPNIIISQLASRNFLIKSFVSQNNLIFWIFSSRKSYKLPTVAWVDPL